MLKKRVSKCESQPYRIDHCLFLFPLHPPPYAIYTNKRGIDLSQITRRPLPLLYIISSLCSALPLRVTLTPFSRGSIVVWRVLPRLRHRRARLRGKCLLLRSHRQLRGQLVDRLLSAKRAPRLKLLGMNPSPSSFVQVCA